MNNNIMTEEGSGGCLICFSKNENCDVLSDEESQMIINNCWKYLHENIANSKLQQTGNSIDENQRRCCQKCFDATSELIRLSEHVKKWKKQISDLKFEFSLGVLYRRTEVESLNSKSDDLSKDFIMLDVSRISPSLFTMDQPTPTSNMMEDFEYPSENSCVEKDAVLSVPQPLLEIVKQKHESNECFDDNSLVLECPDEEGGNLIKNPLVDIQDSVTISKKAKYYPASRTDREFIDNITSQIDDPRSAAVTDGGDTNGTKAASMKPVDLSTKVTAPSDVSDGFNPTSTSCSQKPPLNHLLRNESSNRKSGEATTSSNIILERSNGSLNKSSTEVHESVGNGQTNHKCDDPDEKAANLIKNALVDIQEDGVTISKKAKYFPANRTDMEFIDNITSQIDDPRSAAVTDGGDTNGTKAASMKPVDLSTKVTAPSDVSDGFNSTICSQKPPIRHLLRNKSSISKRKKFWSLNIGKATTTTSSNIILQRSSGNLKKSYTEVHERVGNGQTNHKCCSEKVGNKVWICPACGRQEAGSMICCDTCDEWYHFTCVGIIHPPETEQWFCHRCENKKKSPSSSSGVHKEKFPKV